MGASGEVACSRCGTPVAAVDSYLSEAGSVCADCFVRVQAEQVQIAVSDERLHASLSKRAWYVGGLHVIWAVVAIVAAASANLPGWLSSLFIVATLVLAYALRLRWRSAFLTAIALDLVGVVACIVWGGVSMARGSSPLEAVLAVFPLAMFGFLWRLRDAYVEVADSDGLRRRGAANRWLAPGLVVAALVGIAAHLALRPKPNPARQLVQEVLPAWEAWRAHGGHAGGAGSRQLIAAARPWPGVAAALDGLDRAWPDETAVRASVKALDGALGDAGLPYFVDVWVTEGAPPILLTHTLVARVLWRVGESTVEVHRLRRLDELNVELGLYGATTEGLPEVMLDRVEAGLANDLAGMFSNDFPGAAELNDFDRAVLSRSRSVFGSSLGPPLAEAGRALADRARLLEEMRARLNGGRLQLDPPDGFVLGDAWLAKLEPLADQTPPLLLEPDLQKVLRADEKLRGAPTVKVLDDMLERLALSTEAHEARHAADEDRDAVPPPPQLFEAMQGSSTMMIGLADKELRAYLGEIHDAPIAACLTLARLMRQVHGKHAAPTPHAFATTVILDQLVPRHDLQPQERLQKLCDAPDPDLRSHIADVWHELYGATMPSARRLGAD